MIIEAGHKLLVVHRRLFENDRARYFIGTVDGYDYGIAKVTGNTWIKEQFGGCFFKKTDTRTKIISISSGTLIIYQLPQSLNLNSVKLENTEQQQETLTDGASFKMDLAEIEYPRQTKMSR